MLLPDACTGTVLSHALETLSQSHSLLSQSSFLSHAMCLVCFDQHTKYRRAVWLYRIEAFSSFRVLLPPLLFLGLLLPAKQSRLNSLLYHSSDGQGHTRRLLAP